jgi:hypothetical protein
VFADDSLLPVQRAPAPVGTVIISQSRVTGRDHRHRAAAALVLAVAVVVAAVAFVAQPSHSWYPARWDARIAPIAKQVAQIRNLTFEHPVPVHFLTPQAFERRIGSESAVSAEDRIKLANEGAQLRALGLMDGTIDLEKALGTAQESGTLAFYDEVSKEVVVRGSVLDVAHRVTLAHELTHVLQDQHLDLHKIRSRAAESRVGEGNAFLALVEGDAVHVQNTYLQRLPAAEQREYARENGSEQDRVQQESQSVPDIVDIEMAAPYVYGPQTIRVLIARGGTAAVNRALANSTPSTVMFLQPGVLEPGTPVATPAVPQGFAAVDASDRFGAFDLYLMLAARLDPQRALAAADLTSGGRSILYRRAGTAGAPICTSVAVAAPTGPKHAVLAGALRAWAAGTHGATVTDGGATLTVAACDPGRSVKGPSTATMRLAEGLVELRGELMSEFVTAGAPADVARCATRLLTRRAELVTPLLQHPDAAPTPAQAAALRSAAQQDVSTCRLTGGAA